LRTALNSDINNSFVVLKRITYISAEKCGKGAEGYRQTKMQQECNQA